jgi:glycosyltransferase involved in cell wall biosynthesis
MFSSTTVIIPTHNRRALVIRALEALEQQTGVEGEMDVVVVVDGSVDGTAEALAAGTWPFRLTVVEQSQAGQAAARNKGAREATGDWLIFLDDDMIPRPSFVSEIQSCLVSGADLALGTVILPHETPENVLSHQFTTWREENADTASVSVSYEGILFSATGIRKPVFLASDGFDEAFTANGGYGNEDIELGYRLLAAGYRVEKCRAAKAETDPLLVPADMLTRTRKTARADVRLVAKHPELARQVFGAKLGDSRLHRIACPVILQFPSLERVTHPLKTGLMRVLGGNWIDRVPYRLWFGIQVLEYWYGVVEAGGGHIVRTLMDGQEQ